MVLDETAAKSFTLQAMALDMPHTPGHPNKHPFKGVLTRIDTLSDKAPEGSKGNRVILPRDVAEKALPTLLGMAVNLQSDLEGHNQKVKIGLIEKAEIIDDAINIEGFLYASDFPDEVKRIQSEKDRLGFSWEIQCQFVEDKKAAVYTITACYFTGAAILYKDKAAYLTTSLAAQAEENNMDKEILELLKAQGEMLKVQGETLSTFNSRLDKFEASAEEDRKKSEQDKLAAAELNASAQKELGDKKVQELEDKLSAQATQIADLRAAAAKTAEEPGRKTLTPQITALLARSGIAMPEGEKKLTVADIDKAFAQTSQSSIVRMEVKNALDKAGLLTA